MKFPHQISSEFYELLYFAGWYPERDILLNSLPFDLKEFEPDVELFLRSLWYITFVKKKFYFNRSLDDINLNNTYYIFGETSTKLANYDSSDEFNGEYVELLGSNKKIACFCTKAGRDILIDVDGRIYEIPDSGDLYYLGGKYYEGLYNLIYNIGDSYIALGDGIFINEKTQKKYHINDI